MEKKDLDFILSVLKDSPIEPDAPDWYAILGFVELNKIAGYFYNRVKEQGISLPQGVDRRLSYILGIQAERNRLLTGHAWAVSAALKDRRIPFAFLKGTVLSNANLRVSELVLHCTEPTPERLAAFAEQRKQLFYGAGERVSNDIDILVEPSSIGAVSAALKETGFINGYYDFRQGCIVPFDRREVLTRRMNRGETAPFVLPGDGSVVPFVEIDVNFSLGYLPNGDERLLAGMLAEPVDYAGTIRGGVRSLGVYDFFLHLIMHQYKESTLYSMVRRGKDAELYKLLDMYLFIKRGYVDVPDFIEYARLKQLETPTYCVLRALFRVFDDMPAETLERIRPDAPAGRVIDPGSGKSYAWTLPEEDRLLHYDAVGYLKEAADV